MPDQATSELPRIALVFGDDAVAAHVREAMHGHADIVYAASAADFDATRMTGANAAAALVNLDDCDWLDAIEASLDTAGVAVVFNDPEISQKLEGWERARWLRHLLAKLSGSTDVDPPRPQQVDAPVRDLPAAAEADPPIPAEAAVVERPLSPQEIETMTADFVAGQEPAPVRVAEASLPPAAAEDLSTAGATADAEDFDAVEAHTALPAPAEASLSPVAAEDLSTAGATADAEDFDTIDAETALAVPAKEALAPAPVAAAATDPAPDADAPPVAEQAGSGSNDDGAPDVDTETLSAMIDARLAESESQTPSDAPAVWRVVEGGAVSPVHLDTVAETDPAKPPTAAAEPSAQQRAETAAQDDADILAGLPSLDDWQLVDPEAAAPAPAAAREHKDAEPIFSDNFAGLELVPMETISTVEIHSDPIERWLDDDESGKRKAATDSAADAAKAGSNGGKA